MKQFVTALIFASQCLSALAIPTTNVINRISCNDYGDYYIGEACILHLDRLETNQSKTIILLDLADFYKKYNFINHGNWRDLSAEIYINNLIPCAIGHYEELAINQDEVSCWLAKSADINIHF